MKKMLLVCCSLLLTGCGIFTPACNVNKGEICFDEKINQYTIEENATLRVVVENETIGLALQQLWNTVHPNNLDVIHFEVQSKYDGEAYLNSKPDVGLIWSNDAARLLNEFKVVDAIVTDEITSTIPSQYGSSVNHDDFVFTPMIGYGFTFSYNETMLLELGFDLNDQNQDGKPDAFDTWEEIMIIADALDTYKYHKKPIKAVYEFNFDEDNQAMTYLSLDGFLPFETFEAEVSGFDSLAFLNTLKAVQTLGSHIYSTAEEATFDGYLNNSNQMFGLVGSWMIIDGFEESTEQNFKFMAMPSYNGKSVNPFTLSVGYVINKETLYPNAAYQFIRMIRSEAGLQIFGQDSRYPLLYQPSNKEGETPFEISFSNENIAEMSVAMRDGVEESMVAYAADSSVRGWSIIQRFEIYEIMKQVFNQELTPKEAQALITEKIKEEMNKYQVKK